jgi:hypothetical protein
MEDNAMPKRKLKGLYTVHYIPKEEKEDLG